MTAGFVVHERMNERDDREARRRGGVGDRRPATIGVPAQHLPGKGSAAHGVRPRSEPHAPRRHLKNIGAAGRVEHVRPFEILRERLAIRAVTDEAKARGWRHLVRDAAHMATPAAEREVGGHAHIVGRVSRRRNPPSRSQQSADYASPIRPTRYFSSNSRAGSIRNALAILSTIATVGEFS